MNCVACGAPANQKDWRLFYPFQSFSARAGHLCAEHMGISRTQFDEACFALPENKAIAEYRERNRKQIEKEQRQAKRGASPETLAKARAAKATSRPSIKTETGLVSTIGHTQRESAATAA